ncbi:hypothetical protein ACA545_01860, partial [Vibrio cholerae]
QAAATEIYTITMSSAAAEVYQRQHHDRVEVDAQLWCHGVDDVVFAVGLGGACHIYKSDADDELVKE